MKKASSLLKLMPMLLLCPLAQGCVGFVVRDMQTETCQPAYVGEERKHYLVDGKPREHYFEGPTTAWLTERWGAPSHVTPVKGTSGAELWTYDFESRWCGFIPYLIIPIPLILPVGQERIVFHIQDGRVAKAEVVRLGGYTAVVGARTEGGFGSTFGPF